MELKKNKNIDNLQQKGKRLFKSSIKKTKSLLFYLFLIPIATISFDVFLKPSIEEMYNQIFIKKFLKNKINQVYIGANIDSMNDIIGTPDQVSEIEGYISSVYINDYFFFEIISNPFKRIVGYSVTLRNPQIDLNFYFSGNRIELGKMTFQEFRDMQEQYTPDRSFGSLMFHDLYYEDTYTGYYAHSSYQSYAVTLSDSGYLDCYSDKIISYDFINMVPFHAPPEDYKFFLKNCKFNTFSIFENLNLQHDYGYYGHQFGINQYEHDLYEGRIEFN